MKSNDEKELNKIYKDVIGKTLEDKGEFCPFRYEKQMDYLFEKLTKDFKDKNDLKILDACSGYGRLIHFLNEFDPNQKYYGIDYVEELIKKGNNDFSKYINIKFECLDVMNLSKKYNKEFDYTINYKTLSWLPYYEQIIKELIAVTKNKIYITSLFWDGNIDFISKIYSNVDKNDTDYNYLNTYSLPKFKKYCMSLGAKEINAVEMKLGFELPKNEDNNALQTYTIQTKDNDFLEVTGNVILNWKLVEILL